jgi:hypothetical protein
MRPGLLVAGIVVLVIGVALLLVPVIPQTSETVRSTSNTPYYEGSVSGYSLTGTTVVSVTWSTNSSVAVTVLAAACSGGCTNISQVSGVTSENGTTGSFTLNQPNGGSVLMGEVYGGPTPVSVTFKITTSLGTVGTILVVLGILLLIAGAVLGRRAKPAATTTPPAAPAVTESPPPPGSSGTPPTP